MILFVSTAIKSGNGSFIVTTTPVEGKSHPSNGILNLHGTGTGG